MTDRHTVDTINSDQLDQLYDRIKKLAQTIHAFPDANDAANLAHARAQRDTAYTRATRAEATLARVQHLAEQWVKAGPPPLGTSINRWWDKRLVELHNAIRPTTDQTTEK